MGPWIGAVIVWLAAMAAGPAFAAPQPPSAPLECNALATSDFSRVREAATQIVSTRSVAATAAVPAHCLVDGYVAPSIGFRLWLPQAWNGKYAQTGCGGYCGDLIVTGCQLLTARGYACLSADMGHKSTTYDNKWAYNDLQAEIDFGYRSTHVSAVAGKAITARFYARPPAHAYWIGASQGGRQGVMEAQRFPGDFDGIVAGEPSLGQPSIILTRLWNILALTGADGRAVISADEVRALNKAAVAACDGADGLKDGLIEDPRTCRFDPGVLQCRPGGSGTCLDEAKLAAVRKVYAGPTDSRGRPVTSGSVMPGSELHWLDAYVMEDGAVGRYARNDDVFRYMAFMPDPGPNWTMADFDWDQDPARFALMEPLLNAGADFRRFKAAGGKMILYQGWNDEAVFTQNVIDLYETAERIIGSRRDTQSFLRLFMVPGQGHIPTGAGAESVDYLSHLEAWVERGVAPDRIVAAHLKAKSLYAGPLVAPQDLTPQNTAFTRPLFPYPLQARYDGRGDPAAAASFRPAGPR